MTEREREKQLLKDNYYLDIAQTVATKSTCLRRKYGAVIVKNDEIISTGYNGAPRDCLNCNKVGCVRDVMDVAKGDSYNMCAAVHAEQNAMISARRVDMIEATIYIVGLNQREPGYADPHPCLLCHRMIVNAGIIRCVGRENDDTAGSDGAKAVELDISAWRFMKRMQMEYKKLVEKVRETTDMSDPEAANRLKQLEDIVYERSMLIAEHFNDRNIE